jgi:hypothetical protein
MQDCLRTWARKNDYCYRGVFATFLIFITVVVSNLFQLGSDFFEWGNAAQLFKFAPFLAISTLLAAIVLYLLGLARVLAKLFQAFWSSLEDED